MSHMESLADQIVQYGVKHIFGIPGSGPSYTLIDLLCQKGVLFHLVHFEGCAAIMAGTVGRLSGKSGVSIAIKGPGLANLLPGLAACSLDSFPAVNITEAYAPDVLPSQAHKRIDHTRLVTSVVKESAFWSEKESSFKSFAQTAEAECPGPVHLNITGGAQEKEGRIQFSRYMPHEIDGDVLKAIERAQAPLFIAGSLAIRAGFTKHLNALHIPVLTTASAKGVVDETLAHAAGVYTGAGLTLSPEENILSQADLLIAIGLRYNEVLTVRQFPCASILLDPLGDSFSKDFNFDTIAWQNSERFWEEFWVRFDGVAWGKERIAKSNEAMCSSLLPCGFMPAHVLNVVAGYFNGKNRVVVDTGLYCTVAEHFWNAISPSSYIGSGQGRYMGLSIPQGIAAALYDPSLPTVIFCGDGSIGMFVSELKIAISNALPLIVVLISDGKFGTLRDRAVNDGLTELPVTISSPSWVKVMDALGMCAVCADTESKLAAILEDWDGKPLYIETVFNSEDYRTMTKDIR